MHLYRKFRIICCSARAYTKAVNVENDTEKLRRKLKSYCHPSLSNEHISKIRNVIGLHITSSDVGWAEVDIKDREIERLGCVSLQSNIDRMNLSDLYHVAWDTLHSLPEADHYIIENTSRHVSGNAGRLQLSLQSARLQLVAMLISLFNSRISHENSADVTLFMRNRIHGRLYSLLIGSEMVTVEETIAKLFRGQLSAVYTPMNCSPSAISEYSRYSKMRKEFIGHALLTATSFAELVVYANVNCAEMLKITIAGCGRDEENEKI